MSKRTRFLVISGLIAALYAALTYMSAALGLAYGQVQLRLSEALCVLCAFSPAAVTGLTVGCLISNIASSLGLVDMLVGTAATLLAALIARTLSGITLRGLPILLPLPFIVINMVAVGGELAVMSERASLAVFALNATTVGIGQVIACYLLGMPLYMLIKSSPLSRILNEI